MGANPGEVPDFAALMHRGIFKDSKFVPPDEDEDSGQMSVEGLEDEPEDDEVETIYQKDDVKAARRDRPRRYTEEELDQILQRDAQRAGAVHAAENIPGIAYESVDDMLSAATKILAFMRTA